MIRSLIALLALFIAAPAIAQEGARTIGPLPNVTLGRWIDALPGKGVHQYDDLTVRDVDRTCSQFCIRISDGSERVLVERGVYHHNGSPEQILAIFSLGSSGSMTLRNVTAIGGKDARKVKTAFPNVDDVMAAQRTFLTIEGGSFSNAWDAGIDTKATTTLKGTVTLANNGVNLKVWGPLTAETIISRTPERGHISCLSSPVVLCNVHIRKLIAYDTNPDGLLVGFQGPGTVRVDECELHVPASYRVTWAKAKVTGQKLILGPTCAKDGKIVVAPVKAATPAMQVINAGQLLPDGSKDGLIKLGSEWAAKLKLKTGTVVRHLDGFRYQVVR